MATIKTDTLYPNNLPLTKPLAAYKVILSDLDHTLIDQEVAHAAAVEALAHEFSRTLAQSFSDVYAVLLDGHRREANEVWPGKGAHDALLYKLAAVQSDKDDVYGLRKWSREMWFYLVAQKHGIAVTKTTLDHIRDLYWQTFATNSTIFDDAKQLLNEINMVQIPLILFTGSDSIMQVDDALHFSYDPSFSETYKLRRIHELPIKYNDVLIGDPYDKPSPTYFARVFDRARKLGGGCDFSEILVIGDSPSADLAYPESLGCDTILITRP